MKESLVKWIAGLRELADFAEQQPDLFGGYNCGETVNLFASDAESMAEKTRLLGKSTKVTSDGWYIMRRWFGPHRIELNIARDNFCERVQTGTKTVSKPDPEALAQVPTVEVSEPVYEWICPESVLAHGAAAEATP